MNRCLRCDWSGDDLTGHVLDSGHPACIVCAHSLAPAEQRTCQRCVARVRADLADIENLYSMLPDAAEALKPSWSASEGRSGGESHGIPGGDALVLLGPGSEGAFWNVGGTGPARVRWQCAKCGEETVDRFVHLNRHRPLPAPSELDLARDWFVPLFTEPVRKENPNLATDPPSALFELARWEDDWRQYYRHPAAGMASVADAVAYLTANLDTGSKAAATHPAFNEFTTDVGRLRHRLQQAVGAAETPVRAPASCFDCDGPLERGWTDHGLADDWTCRWCKRIYTAAEYLLAVRARLEERRAS